MIKNNINIEMSEYFAFYISFHYNVCVLSTLPNAFAIEMRRIFRDYCLFIWFLRFSIPSLFLFFILFICCCCCCRCLYMKNHREQMRIAQAYERSELYWILCHACILLPLNFKYTWISIVCAYSLFASRILRTLFASLRHSPECTLIFGRFIITYIFCCSSVLSNVWMQRKRGTEWKTQRIYANRKKPTALHAL